MSKVKKRYFRQSLLLSAMKSPLDVGAVCSSSRSLASGMVDVSNLQANENIVEVGAGTGVITAEVASRLPSGCGFASVEKSSRLARVARERLKGEVNIIEADIRDVGKGCLGRVDCLISSLPMTLWKSDLQKEVIQSMHSHMAKNGRMIFFSYLTSNIFGKKNSLFDNLLDVFSSVNKNKIVWSNAPPARIYVCSNEQLDQPLR